MVNFTKVNRGIDRMQPVLSGSAFRDGHALVARLRENFAANLKRLLQDAGYDQKTFAKELGVSEAIVSKWMRLKNFPEDQMIDRIVGLLGVSYEDLVKAIDLTSQDPIVKFIRDLARHRGYDLVKKS